MNNVVPIQRNQVVPNPQTESYINPQNINIEGEQRGGMANPSQPLNRQDSSQLQTDPQQILDAVYLNENGTKSEETDEPFFLGIRRCIGSMCECCTNEEIKEGSVGVITEFGKFVKVVGSGAQSYNCCSQVVIHVPTVIQVMHLPSQSVITKDGLQLLIKSYVKFRIVHPQLYLFNHQNASDLLLKAIQGTLRSVVGQRTLKENLGNQVEIKKKIARLVKHRVEEYGLVIYDTEIERMSMDQTLQKALAIVAKSEREAKARVVKAQGNKQSSIIYKKAADEFSKNPLAIQLKYLDVLKDVAAKQSTLLLRDTIVDELKKKNLK